LDKEGRLKVLEVLLWMTDRPLKYADFKDILGTDCPPEAELREEVLELGRGFDSREAPMQLMEVAEGFQVSSRTAFSPWIRRLYKDKTTLRLSTSALETLSIVAYKQPITRGEIEEIRGVEVTGVLETLLAQAGQDRRPQGSAGPPSALRHDRGFHAPVRPEDAGRAPEAGGAPPARRGRPRPGRRRNAGARRGARSGEPPAVLTAVRI
jgi:chromosome segregation and condensation protein ScpB